MNKKDFEIIKSLTFNFSDKLFKICDDNYLSFSCGWNKNKSMFHCVISNEVVFKIFKLKLKELILDEKNNFINLINEKEILNYFNKKCIFDKDNDYWIKK